jgi:transglutaminase-like putative cysteine protease
MTVFVVRHLTKYRYKRLVRLGEHRLMFRPRDSFDQRLLHSHLDISPKPCRVRWIHDVFGNCVTLFDFDTSSAYIEVESTIRLEHTPENVRTSKSKNTPSFTRSSTPPSNSLTCLPV